jgi:hypothetical protein
MPSDYAAAARNALAHERTDRKLSRLLKAFECACLAFALFGTVSTIAPWQAIPGRATAATDGRFVDGDALVQPLHEGFDLGAFVQIASR